MHTKTACQTETLLNGSNCDLLYCPDCKMIHLVLGAITLHLPEDHFQKLANDLSKGVFKLTSRNTSLENLFNDAAITLHS
ncbi:MAG: hypothetical protein ACI9FO_000169 [Methylophagaceae bacterium]|jgi:hypothetical protein